MITIIQTPDFKAAKKVTSFVEAHIAKLEVLNNRIEESRVCLKLDKSDTKENKICEIKLVIPGNDLFAVKRSDTFEDATLQTIEALKHQLHRWKDSRNKRFSESTPLVAE
jgi:putative sigma-54 modulation protein